MNTGDLPELDARAVRVSLALVSQVTDDDDLGKPTPCGPWTLGELIAHMTAQHHGFAASARGGAADLADWQPQAVGSAAHAVTGYTKAADDVLAAFAEDGVLDRQFALPEILPGAPFPGQQAVSFHLVDYVVHSWDVARSLGEELTMDPDVLEAARRVAVLVPGGSYRTQPGAAFAPAVPAHGGHGKLDEIVAMLGRRPTWPS
jgi:uncharacterized protein (TIGR03086 family)